MAKASDQFCSEGGRSDLHDIGRIGAEHHHFAMRHIDDAHDAEGDRKADRRQKQNRRRRKPVPEVLRHAPHGEAGMDRGESRCGGALHRRVGGLLRDPVDEALRVLVAALLQRRDRGETILRRSAVAGGEDRRLGELQCGGDARIAFLGELRLKRRQRLGVVGPEHVLGRGEPLLGIGIGEGQRPHRAFDGASQRIVDADFLEGGGVDACNRLRRSWR